MISAAADAGTERQQKPRVQRSLQPAPAHLSPTNLSRQRQRRRRSILRRHSQGRERHYVLIERKGKEEYLYSAFYILCISQSAQAWITVLPANTPCLPFS